MILCLSSIKATCTGWLNVSTSFNFIQVKNGLIKSATKLSNGSGLILKIYKRIMNVFTIYLFPL